MRYTPESGMPPVTAVKPSVDDLDQLIKSWEQAAATGATTGCDWEAGYAVAFTGVYLTCAKELKAVRDAWRTT